MGNAATSNQRANTGSINSSLGAQTTVESDRAVSSIDVQSRSSVQKAPASYVVRNEMGEETTQKELKLSGTQRQLIGEDNSEATSRNQSEFNLAVENSLGDSRQSQSSSDEEVRLRAKSSTPKIHSSRRSSTDSSEEGSFNSTTFREMRGELKELEDKFKRAMVANAGLDNEKTALTFQVEALKDRLEEREEQQCLTNRELREKNREFELLKRSHAEATRAVQLLQAQLDEQARLVAERGMVFVGQEEGEQVVDEDEQEQRTRAVVSSKTASVLANMGSGPLDVRIKRLADERDDLLDEVRRLKLDLDEERGRSAKLEHRTQSDNDNDSRRGVDDSKFKLQRAEQEISTLQTNVARLETQVLRYKQAAEQAEQAEEELKTERRKLQRELREASSRADELETTNRHLETRLGKLKTAKSNLLKDL